jgi:glycosyltransferase involved in cell wall biosynthesis
MSRAERICFYTEVLSSPVDEGIRRVAFTIAKILPEYCEATIICSTGLKHEEIERLHVVGSQKPFFKLYFNQELRQLLAKISRGTILYIPSAPSNFTSFIRASILAHHARSAKTVLFLLQLPTLSAVKKKLIGSIFRPDLILVPSKEMEWKLVDAGCRAKFVPLGVDTDKFTPASDEHKEHLRRKYGIDTEAFVVLHVGHLNENRNLRLFIDVKKATNAQIIIAGSTSTHHDKNLVLQLRNEDIICLDSFIQDIEELYQLSDLYVFPTLPGTGGCIEMPLSVLEAMACNIRVASTRYGGLPDIFEEKDGFLFADNNKRVVEIVAETKRIHPVRTREMVMPYNWENVIRMILQNLS